MSPATDVAAVRSDIEAIVRAQDADTRYELSADLVTMTEARPTEAEAIRTIRTHIMAQHMTDGRRGLAVCAATSKVGCTFTAANLAVALSQAGLTTLLVDGNMRKPQVDCFLRPTVPSVGLKQYLTMPDHPMGDFIHHDVLANLSIMYAGGVSHNAQELLAGEGFKSFVQRCLRDFEFTIIDTPAADTVADALRISSMIGYSLIVARAHLTRVSEVSTLAKQLQDDGAKVIGTVLNEV